jgi:phage terminase large subunit
MFKRTTAVNKILKMRSRIRVIQGGTSAGKTYAIIPILINRAIKEQRIKITVVAETLPAVKEGALDIFKTIMIETNRWIENNWNASSLTYTFTNGSRMQFKSFDSDGKAKASGKRDILFLNEANHIPFIIADALMIRSAETYIDFNPDNEFWVHSEILPQHNAEFLLLTYLDNEGISKETLEDLMIKKEKAKTSNYWANWWRVYGEGQIGNLQGVVFSNWQTIDTIPNEARLLGIGLDFGYTNDPTSAIAVYKWNDKRIVKELFYRTGMLNGDIANALPKDTVIYADSAEPKSIEEIRRRGLQIYPVTKSKDSINYGIDVMQQQEYLVTSDSTNLIKELRGYCWDVDRTGKTTNKPQGGNDHCFIGDTLITTINGDVKIKDIQIGDFVLTSKGYKKVLKTFNNGMKQVNRYSMQLDTNFVHLCSTKEHKIKTTKGWKIISELQQNNTLYQFKYLTEKNIGYIKEKDILAVQIKDYTLKFGNFLKEKFQKVITFITLTETEKIIIYQILLWFKLNCIYVLKVKKGLEKTQNGQKIFIQKELKKQKNGINQMKVENGIQNTEKKRGLIENIKYWFAKYVKKNTKQGIQENQNIVIQTAKLKHLEIGESWIAPVYDIMVEDCHEYFANGILVHNCIDALRYHEMESISTNKGVYNIY